jgi:acyl dehydratase
MVDAVTIPIPGIVYRQNYGFDRVRIVQPVKVDDRIRGRFELNRIEPKGPRGMLVHLDVSMEIEGDDIAPAVVAEWLAYVRVED